jgi:hypothetical protein
MAHLQSCKGYSSPPNDMKSRSEHGNSVRLLSSELGSPRRPETDDAEGGAFVVVRAWESHAHGEGKQEDDGFV